MIKGKRNSAVILSQEDWENIQETIYLLSIPQMKESIIEADKEADEECAKEINW
jgi:PHD/YefM family antitoxin component YafN of YafNO toxin-antitoxin module